MTEEENTIQLIKTLKECVEANAKLIRDTAETVSMMKDEIMGELEAQNSALTERLMRVETYQKTILEPNQKILFKKLCAALDLEPSEESK